MQQEPRQHAFCAHTIQRCDPLVVWEASRDERFRDNPLVRGQPGIRVYAGVPLKVAEDLALGALCVMDRRPRRLRARRRAPLTSLPGRGQPAAVVAEVARPAPAAQTSAVMPSPTS